MEEANEDASPRSGTTDHDGRRRRPGGRLDSHGVARSERLTTCRPLVARGSPRRRESSARDAHELGYQVNLVGRALRKGRTATVGLLVPDLDNPFFSSLAQHLSTAFEGSATDVLIFTAGEDLDVERRGVEFFLGRQVDAVVIIPCDEIGSTDAVLAAAHAVCHLGGREVVLPVDGGFINQ